LSNITRALEGLLEQFDGAGSVATIDILASNGEIVTAKVTPETEEAIENAYAALEANETADFDFPLDEGC
jgi:hypothetical protein